MVARTGCVAALKRILESESLYQYAARQEGVRTFTGRAPVYALSLDDNCGPVVVRHAIRGGMISRVSRDVFLRPTRGFRELLNSLRLRALGVSTPEVMACISYEAGWMLRRSDVVTEEIRGGHDLSVVLKTFVDDEHRRMALDATAKLVQSLTHAGAYHMDLNLKNILLTSDDGSVLEPHVLDIDRIRFNAPWSPLVARANLDRLLRSLVKWRETKGLRFTDDEAAYLTSRSMETRA